MRKLAISSCAAAALIATALVMAAAVTAAPIQGGQKVSGVGTSEFFHVVFASKQSTTCSFPSTAQVFGGTNLTVNTQGWVAQRGLTNEHPEVWLHANVHGTYNDRSGDVYQVNGEFLQTGIANYTTGSSVAYDGVGHISIIGPRGVISGQAEFMIIPDPPQEWLFWFNRIDACTAH